VIHHLRAAGVSLIVDARGTKVPTILHWGADVGELAADSLIALADGLTPAIPPSSIDAPPRLSLLPTVFDGWSGRPGVGKAEAVRKASHHGRCEDRGPDEGRADHEARP
jgi:alpha-galactosidase